MGAKKRCLRSELSGDSQRTRLVLNAEAVAALDLNGGRALGAHLGHTRTDKRAQLLIAGSPGVGDRTRNTAAVVRNASQPGGELGRAVPGEDEVRVRVDETRDNRAPADVPTLVCLRCLRRRTDPRNEPVLHDDRSVAQAAQKLRVVGTVQKLVVGDQLGDAVDQGRGHERSQRGSIAF